MTSPMTEDAIHAFAEEFIRTILAGDVDMVISLYTDDATIWHNFDDVEQTPTQNGKTLRALHRLIPGFHYDDIRRTILADGFWQQHVLRAPTADGELSIPAALRVYIRDGRISRLEEYLDPAPFATVFGR